MTATGAPSRLDASPLSRTRVAFLAVAAAIATSTSYTVHPELDDISRDLNMTVGMGGVAAAAAIVGYMCGLATLVPLVDFIRPHRLVSGQLFILGLSLLLASSATNPVTFGAALFLSGGCASTGAQMSTLAGKHSTPARRGRAVGAVTAGISGGILIGRIVGGALTDALGWRPMLATFALGCFLCAAAAYAALPRTVAESSLTYASTLRSLPNLFLSHRLLRASAAAGALWFFSFSLIWVSLSIALALPPHNLPPAVIGLYALAGLLGIATTWIAGAVADRHGATRVILAGLTLAMVCAVVMCFALGHPLVILTALALFDVGLFAAQVANQSRVLSIDAHRPARFNSTYMVIYFIGGSLGTSAGAFIVTRFGWPLAPLVASLTIIIAAAITLRARTITADGR